jgi:uncharacterized protein
MTALNQALSAEELDELGDFLSLPDMEDRSMDLSMLEGFLTAIIIGPHVVMPSQWVSWVWDAEEGREEAVFSGLDQANRIMGLLMRFQNGIAHDFMTDPAAFEPMFWREARWGAAEWCEGFLLGTQFHSEAWARLWLLQPTCATPFLRLGTDDGMRITVKEGVADRWMRAVAPTLGDIHAYWQAQRASQLGALSRTISGSDASERPPCAARQKLGAMIRVHTAAGKSSRNVAARQMAQRCCIDSGRSEMSREPRCGAASRPGTKPLAR